MKMKINLILVPLGVTSVAHILKLEWTVSLALNQTQVEE